MAVYQLEHYDFSPGSAWLSGIGQMLQAAYGTRQSERARKQAEDELALRMKRELDQDERQKLLSDIAIHKQGLEEAMIPKPGKRPMSATEDVPVTMRTGGPLSTLVGQQPPINLGPAAGQDETAAPPPESTVTQTSMQVAAPEPMSIKTVPGVSFHGKQILSPVDVGQKYETEAEADAIRQQKLMNGYMELKEPMRLGEGPDAITFQAGELVPPTIIPALVRASATAHPRVIPPKIETFETPGGGKIYRTWDQTGDTPKLVRIPGIADVPAQTEPGPVPPGAAGLTGEAYLKAVEARDPGLANQLRSILAGKQALEKVASLRKPKGDQMSERNMLSQMLTLAEPGWEAAKFRSRQEMRDAYSSPKFAAGMQLQSVNTLVKHLKTLHDRVTELDASQFPAFNRAWQGLLKATGDPRVDAALDAADAVARERARILQGGTAAPTKEDIIDAKKRMGPIKSPDQINGIIADTAELMTGRLTTLYDDWMRIIKEPPDEPFIYPRTMKILRELGLERLVPPEVQGAAAPAATRAGVPVIVETK